MVSEAVTRARQYPFRQPSGSYLFAGAGTRPLLPEETPDGDGMPPGFEDRTPVLAYASNASPEALARKFGMLSSVRIPVTVCELDGFDAVYSRHFYNGYIPATLAASPGTSLRAFTTWLDPEELDLMNGSEHLGVNYELRPLADAVARLGTDGGGPGSRPAAKIREPLAYQGLHGELVIGGHRVAVAGTTAANRRLPELDQDGVLELARAAIAPDLGLEQMIASTISSPSEAARLTGLLKRWSPN